MAVNLTLNVAAGLNFVGGGVGNDSASLADTISYYDLSDQSQAVLLSSEGVNFGQGWLFAQALSAAQFIELVTCGRRLVSRRIDDEA